MPDQDKKMEAATKKTFTGKDVIEAAKDMLREDGIGKKLPDDVLEKLSKLLAKTVLKGDL